MAADSENQAQDARTPGPALRLVDRRAYVGFPSLSVMPGVTISDFALQIPDVTFPMNITGGAGRYQKKRLDFGLLELDVSADVINRKLAELQRTLGDLDELKLHFRPGYLEAQARLRTPDRAPVTFKIAFDGDGERLAVYCFDVRLYSFSATPASRIAAQVSEAVKELGLLPDVERRGANGFSARILPPLVELAAVGRGFKMPLLDQARLVEASVSSSGLRLRFSSGGIPPAQAPDEELMLTLEGARAFADAEEYLAQGKLKEAREAYLRLGDANDAHPFAVERLLTLLVADPQAHELALDVAASLIRRRDRSATALWAEAVVRERRGEFARASERYLALSTLARRNQEEAGAFFAAESAARAAKDDAPQMAVRALHELLGLKPDHLPSLKALARASDQARDRAGAIRAYRRLAALARDPAEAADAHVQLARLCAQTEDDIAGARLHCEAALRLTPDHPDALLQLGELCARSGEHLRAIKALDRLREVALGRHEVDRIGKANLLAGQVWETGLKQPENALLRYREAASLLPGDPQPLFFAARVAESLGRIQEAVAGYQQCVELAGPAPRVDEVRKAAHGSHHALARLLKTRLGEPTRAREHLESALALVPTDTIALDELLPYFRASGKAAELADACEKSAAVMEDNTRRAALWAEAGDLYRGRLSQPDRAERLLSQALEADPKNRLALEGMLALAESRRDGGQLTRCLRSLAELATDPKERVRHYRRLAVAARDLAFDLELAVHAYREVLRVEPDDLPVLGELTALERRRGDMPGLAWALETRARSAESAGDSRLAAAALRELGQVLDVRLGRAGEALVALEKAGRLFPEPSALIDLGNLSLRLERAPNARRAFEDALALLPKHAPVEKVAEVRFRLGRACELSGDTDAAREQYAAAFPMRRLDDELAARLEALYVEGNYTRELTDLWASRAQALMQAGRTTDAAVLFFKSAQISLKAGDHSGAILRLTAALDAAPTGEKAPEVLEAMAQLELDRRSPLEAARLYARRAGLATSSREAARWFFKAAVLTRETPREADFLAEALAKDGTFVPARLRRASINEREKPREAFADFEVVLASDTQDADVVEANLDLLDISRRAAFAALASGQFDAARRILGRYTASRPADVEAQVQLVALHRRAGALEPLVDLLGDLWPRLEGQARTAARREYAEGALSLGRTDASIEALRSILTDEPTDAWSASRLLPLLPVDDAHAPERLDLLSRLIPHQTGDARADLLARRAELHRLAGNLDSARADMLEASQASSQPVPLYRMLAELNRQAHDEGGEINAWAGMLERAPDDGMARRDAVERLFGLGQARLAAEDAPHAQRAFETLVAGPLEPEQKFEAWFGLARAATLRNEPRAVEHALLEASKQGPIPRRVAALLERAALLESRSAREEAAQAFETIVELAPRHPKATEGLTRNLRALQDWEGLAEVLSAEATQLPKDKAIPVYTELAALYLDTLKQPGPGEVALRRLVTLDASNVGARVRLADIVAARGDTTEAVELLEAAAALSSAHEASALLWRGAALARSAGDSMVQLRLMRIANALEPAIGDKLHQLADALYLHGAIAEALPLQQQYAASLSWEEFPDLAEQAALRLADLAEASNQMPLAETTLRRLLQMRPQSGVAVERLAARLAETNRAEAFDLLAKHLSTQSPSERNTERLLRLAREALTLSDDVEVGARLFRAAAKQSENPIPVRRELVAALRQANRADELRVELAELARLETRAGHVEEALTAWDEQARLAEGAGQIDEALDSIHKMAKLAADEGHHERASALEVRRAGLLRDSKLDLEGAMQALESAWEFHQHSDIAYQAMSIAHRRSDREAEIDWLERILQGLTHAKEKSAAFVQLARLHLGMTSDDAQILSAPMHAPDQAEAALKQALMLTPRLPAAEQLLTGIYERLDRLGDLAAYFEEAAVRSPPETRAQLLMHAATLYKDRAGQPQAAAAALLAARASAPDDLALTARVADALHELGRRQEAADFDALLLEQNPMHAAFERHRAFLSDTRDFQGLGQLLSLRAQATSGAEASTWWMAAADAFRAGGATERAQVCEAQSFEASPGNAEAFNRLLARAGNDVRRQADLYAVRARALPDQASQLLRIRAEILTAAQETLHASTAWDDYLETNATDASALETRATLAAQHGGPRAAQPFDRRLINLSENDFPRGKRVPIFQRLGHASMESNAWRDAVDAFENVVALDPQSQQGREALTLMSEAYARLNDAAGQFKTTMRLAALAEGAEADALYLRALTLAEAPLEVVAAAQPMLKSHPADISVTEACRAAYVSLARWGDVLALDERFAAAVEGPAGALALLAGAEVAERELQENQRAYELRVRAAAMDERNLGALRLVIAEQRRRNDSENLAISLAKLSERADESEATSARLELAAVHRKSAQLQKSVDVLNAVRSRGPSNSGYREALQSLEGLHRELKDENALADVLRARAELEPSPVRAGLLLEASAALHRAGNGPEALAVAQQALQLVVSKEALEQVIAMALLTDAHAQAAQAQRLLAGMSEGARKRELLLGTVDAWQRAGNTGDALDVFEALLREDAEVLPVAEIASRFLALGAAGRALEVGFEPALASGNAARALELADAALDEGRRLKALWALAEAGAPESGRLESLLRQKADLEGLLRLADLTENRGNVDAATWLRLDLFGSMGSPAALASLVRTGKVTEAATAALSNPSEAQLNMLVPHAALMQVTLRKQLLAAAVKHAPAARAAALRVLTTMQIENGEYQHATETLRDLAVEQTDGRVRAEIHLERAELFRRIDAHDSATEAWEQALVENPNSIAPVTALLQHSSLAPKRTVELYEHLVLLGGTDSVQPFRLKYAQALEAVGRELAALEVLNSLEETTELIHKRIGLAQKLGRTGEALALREKVATSRTERMAVLEGYLGIELIPHAMRMSEALLADGDLSPAERRTIAEKMSTSSQSAALAIRLWPELLRAQLVDADGWTIYAEALGHIHRDSDAALADGFGAALTSTKGSAPVAAGRGIKLESTADESTYGMMPVTDDSFPRLRSALVEALEGLGLTGVQMMLDPTGGTEAWVANKTTLVIGMGALSALGTAELSFLLAVAVALGDAGRKAFSSGESSNHEFGKACASALKAYPASLAACRVAAYLDDSVRGGDPRGVDVGQVLRESPLFGHLALAALELLAR